MKQIPFAGFPTTLEINDLKKVKYTIGSERNEIEINRTYVEFTANDGKRSLKFKSLELLDTDIS